MQALRFPLYSLPTTKNIIIRLCEGGKVLDRILSRFFVIGNAIAGGYLVISLPFSIISIVRPYAVAPRSLLFIFDTIMVALTTGAASSAAAIVYLAHKGNSSANWIAICQQFNDFCQQTSGAVVASFIAAVIFILLIVMSASALRKS